MLVGLVSAVVVIELVMLLVCDVDCVEVALVVLDVVMEVVAELVAVVVPLELAVVLGVVVGVENRQPSKLPSSSESMALLSWLATLTQSAAEAKRTRPPRAQDIVAAAEDAAAVSRGWAEWLSSTPRFTAAAAHLASVNPATASTP